MTKSSRLGMYADVREVLDAALLSNGGEFVLDSHGAAIQWRQRAYKFRKRFAETIPRESPYDKLVLPKIPEGSSTVIIRLRATQGTFVPSEAPAPPIDVDEDLLSAALNLAKDL